MRRMLGLCALAVLAACQRPQPTAMTDAQKAAVADSVKAIAVGMVDKINQGDMTSGWAMYSTDPNARYIENGMVHPGLDAMKKMSAEMMPMMEKFRIDIDATDVLVLGPDAAVLHSPFHMTMKTKGRPEYTGQGVWTGIFQRNTGKWELVSTHESFQHADAMMAATMPAPPARTTTGRR
jgi:uncharacterized protein (TIGR02246 family)